MKLAPGELNGDSTDKRTIGGFQLMEVTYLPRTKIAKHAHSHACFSMMLDGSFIETYGRATSLEWSKFGVAFNPADEEHSNVVHDAGARFFVVEIGREWLDRINEDSARLDRTVNIFSGPIPRLTAQLYREFRQPDHVSELVVEGTVLTMLAAAVRWRDAGSKSPPPRWLDRSRQLIHEHFSESLTLERISESVGTHPIHLAAMFRKHYHCTIGEYVRRLRVEYAAKELTTTSKSISDIALTAGYYDQSHFSRTFKQTTGFSPREYRTGSQAT